MDYTYRSGQSRLLERKQRSAAMRAIATRLCKMKQISTIAGSPNRPISSRRRAPHRTRFPSLPPFPSLPLRIAPTSATTRSSSPCSVSCPVSPVSPPTPLPVSPRAVPFNSVPVGSKKYAPSRTSTPRTIRPPPPFLRITTSARAFPTFPTLSTNARTSPPPRHL